MTRLTLTLAVWIGLMTAAASASLSPRKDSLLLDREAPPARVAAPPAHVAAPPAHVAAPPAQPTGQGARPEFALTEQTTVLLDGKPCRYQDVPANARIVHMEVAADRTTVLTIHFRTGK
jgi:hypothetical protein